MYKHIKIPQDGSKISINNDESLNVPDNPIIPYIEGDGIGVDITPVMIKVIDAAVDKAYNQTKKFIGWKCMLERNLVLSMVMTNGYQMKPLEASKEFVVSIKGPLTTPVGGGIRSINVALRQELDLYVCLRPVRYFKGVPSPLKNPENTDMVIFRENSEDIYAGVEWESESTGAKKLINFLTNELNVKKIRFPNTSGIGVKPISKEGSYRHIIKTIQYAIANKRKSVTFVHKGNIMKYTEGAFRDWGYEIAKNEFHAVPLDGGPWLETPEGIIIKDVIADAFLQQIILRPKEYDVIATMNLNGDYISDALAAQVGGIGIAPGANIGDKVAMFEATHGTAPKYAGKDYVNPGSIILSAEMMLRHLGWVEAADLIIKSIEKTISEKNVTYDFARLMDDANQVSCSGFGNYLIKNM